MEYTFGLFLNMLMAADLENPICEMSKRYNITEKSSLLNAVKRLYIILVIQLYYLPAILFTYLILYRWQLLKVVVQVKILVVLLLIKKVLMIC